MIAAECAQIRRTEVGRPIKACSIIAGSPELEGRIPAGAMTWTLACGDYMVVATLHPEAAAPRFAYTIVEADRHVPSTHSISTQRNALMVLASQRKGFGDLEVWILV